MQNYDRATIQQRFNNGEHLEFVFFWGPHEQNQPKGCFNQWNRSVFIHNNTRFVNAEQAMMAEKAILFDDQSTLAQILECEQPRAVKDLGRLVHPYVDAEWSAVRLQRIVAINYAKFTQNPKMKEHLLNTGDKILVEASPVDGIWGIKMDQNHPDVRNPNLWKGQNLLGQALMIVRDAIRQDDETAVYGQS